MIVKVESNGFGQVYINTWIGNTVAVVQ